MKSHSPVSLMLSMAVILFSTPWTLRAHCDALDGPVVQAAREALAATNSNLVLIWVQREHEPEILNAFAKTLAVRKLGGEAKELADLFFFETVVRLHRAGEGASYTGLKPAGQPPDPAISLADTALREAKIQPLLNFLTHQVESGVREHFDAVIKARDFNPDDVAAGRKFINAYV